MRTTPLFWIFSVFVSDEKSTFYEIPIKWLWSALVYDIGKRGSLNFRGSQMRFKSDYEFWNKCFLLFWKNRFLAFVFDCPFLTQNIPNFPIWLIYLGEIMCVGRVWCLTRAELRPRPAAAQSTPRPLKMSTKFREIVLKSKIHRHLYSNNRGFVSE